MGSIWKGILYFFFFSYIYIYIFMGMRMSISLSVCMWAYVVEMVCIDVWSGDSVRVRDGVDWRCGVNKRGWGCILLWQLEGKGKGNGNGGMESTQGGYIYIWVSNSLNLIFLWNYHLLLYLIPGARKKRNLFTRCRARILFLKISL